jgi:uncharacterized protein (TIGR01370 family)
MSLLKKLLMIFSLLNLSCSQPTNYSFIINYSNQVIIPETIDLIVVSPYAKVRGNKNKSYAYLSLTEINKLSPFFADFPKDKMVKENKAWSSFLVEITHPAWQKVIEQELSFILEQGYQQLFLDTADGVEILCILHSDKCEIYKNQAQKIVAYIRNKTKGKIIINRGFAIYPKIKNMIQGVLIESFFYDKKNGKFVRRGEQDMTWLSEWVTRFKKDNKFILAIDYADKMSYQDNYNLQNKAKKMGISWKLAHELLQ